LVGRKVKLAYLAINLAFETELLEVLVAEYDDLPLSNRKSKFTQTLLRELYTMHFYTEIRTDARDLVVGGGVGLLVVSAAAWVDEV